MSSLPQPPALGDGPRTKTTRLLFPPLFRLCTLLPFLSLLKPSLSFSLPLLSSRSRKSREAGSGLTFASHT